jgi:hypothetical protein
VSSLSKPMGKKVIWFLFFLLFLLHQDFWWWDDTFLVLDFLPIGLAYHAGFSIACAVLGWAAIKYAWPHELEEFAEEVEGEKEAT